MTQAPIRMTRKFRWIKLVINETRGDGNLIAAVSFC